MNHFIARTRGIASWSLVVGLLGVGSLAPAERASGQSIVAGEVEGTVTGTDAGPLRGAAITLIDARTGISRRTIATAGGAFTFDFIPAGPYHVRAELVGYRPALVTDVPIGSGRRVRVPVTLTPQPPPVSEVDTLRWGTTNVPAGVGAEIRRVQAEEVASLPDLRRDLTGLVAMSSAADGVLGLEGLPGGSTTIYAEGEPFRPAAHPRLPGSPVSGLAFPRLGLASVSMIRGLQDIEWAGSEGGIVALESRGASARGGSAFGLWAGDALWSSELVSDPPGATSFWGGAEASLPLVPDTALLTLAVEGRRIQTPLIPSATDTLMADLRPGDAPPAGQPGVAESTAVSGSGRLDWALGGGGHVMARAGVASFESITDRPGTPTLAYGVNAPRKGVDASIAAVVGAPLSENILLEVRGGVGVSSRDYEVDGVLFPSVWLVGQDARLGSDPSFAGTFSRVDFGLGPVLHYRSGPHKAKLGVRFDVTNHDDEYVEGAVGSFLYGNADLARTGRGVFQGARGVAPSAAYTVPRVSVFGQYRWSVLPGLDLTTGVRWEQETLPAGEIRPDAEWLGLSGIANALVDEKVDKLDGRVHLRWDLAGTGRTWLEGGVAVQNGLIDSGALSEVVTLDGPIRAQRGRGTIGQWPTIPDSASAPVFGTRLSLFGDDLQAPRTTRGAASFVTALGGGVSLGVTGSFRRTEFLLRRRDLNRLAAAVGTDQNGRPVYGALSIEDGVLGPDPATSRRFEQYEHVWVLDPDGWSEYGGLTVSLASTLRDGGTITAEYTYSETVDNLWGAASGHAAGAVPAGLEIDEWDEGISDFDLPHRVTISAVLPLPIGTGGVFAGFYRFRSGLPFTPMVAGGLDANGDGSAFNDVAFVPQAGTDAVAALWDCIADFRGSFPDRNACRGDGVHTLDLRLAVGLGSLGGLNAEIVLDALNVTDADTGRPNPGLVLVDPAGQVTGTPDGYSVPYVVNPTFGAFTPGVDPGRWFRIGLRIGGGS